MNLKREVPTRAPRSTTGNLFHGTKILALIVGIAAGIPLGAAYAFQSGLHTSCQDPIVVTISNVRTSPDPELDAYIEARQRVRDMAECRECHPESGKRLTLSGMELCLTDNPACKWVYEIDREGRIMRLPNRAFPVRLERVETHFIKSRLRGSKRSLSPRSIDMFRYESF